MAFGENGDVQLLEISRGARRLSYMVSSWFKVANLDGGSKNAGRGLPKTKEKAGFLGKGGELQGSRRLAVQEEEKLCGSRSWRSCGEELKEVIRDSLYGRSLLLNSSDDEKASSSRSLGFHQASGSNASRRYEEEVNRRNPTTASGKPVKMKAPSLIARLMGLERVPAESIKRKQLVRAPEARRSTPQKIERSRRFDMDDEATSSRRGGAKQEELGSCKTSGRRAAHESETKEVEILKKPEARWSKKSGTAAASACDGRQKSGLDRKQAQSRREVKTAAAPPVVHVHAKKTRTASTEPRKQSIAFGRPVSRSSTVPASAEKKITGSKPAQKAAKFKTTEQKDDEGIMNPSRKAEDASVINILPAAQPPKQRKLLHPRASINEKILCEIMPKPSTSPGKAKAAAAAKLAGSEAGNTARREDKEGYLEGFLLSFLSHGYELSLAAGAPPARHGQTEPEEVDEDAKLYWDCAEESVARRSHHRDLCGHPLLRACSRSSSAADDAAVDELVGEISRGMRRLAGYGEADEEVASTDGLYVRLERDLGGRDGWLNAMWDLGWRNGICVEEVGGVVGQVEERVMSALLDEAAMELKHC
ncbi:hypothetical protein OPV22_015820 [Ensete ventricosum]|uniref:DUF3741 domain-containing protein n=1 Tax=Ensete ventricosum TaxID=4639 RepID=A0AAV8R6H8_ENSVE|nr:hypothetical protein OPV22_015820 [Ensete ventricosum]